MLWGSRIWKNVTMMRERETYLLMREKYSGRKKMRDFIKRLLVGGVITSFISLFLIEAKYFNAYELNEDWIWPTDGEITDVFGTRSGMHKGVDIAAPPNTPVYAVAEGIVSRSYYSDTYGHVVFVKHKDFETVYAHLASRNVSEGQEIEQGEILGKMGNTGDSSGVHLHFEVHEHEWTYSKENAIDPDQALGITEIGQVVHAHSKVISDGSIETAGRLDSTDQKREQNRQRTVTNDKNVHIVQQGETLWSISQKYNLTVSGLIDANQLQGNDLVIGQPLYIGKNGVGDMTYKVVKGDTLVAISRKTGRSVAEIMRKNELNNSAIYPNQVLILD